MEQETQHLKTMYGVFRIVVYTILFFEIILFMPVDVWYYISFLAGAFKVFGIYNSLYAAKIAEIVMLCVTSIGTRAKKDMNFNVVTMVEYPLAAGSVLLVLCFMFYNMDFGENVGTHPLSRWLYAVTSVLSILVLHVALDNTSKYISSKVSKDRFNFEEESFQQMEECVSNEYSVNIPMLFYHKKKMHSGWINIINPFRGTIILGVPGSGKTFSVIEPMMRQQSAKGFVMVVYDYKFPTLAKQLFYLYGKNKVLGNLPKGCNFRIVNFCDVRYSNRVNPIQAKYIPNVAMASETASTLLESLQKGADSKGGSDQFFQKASINFLAAIIFFFVNYKKTGWKGGKRLQWVCDASYMQDGKEKNEQLKVEELLILKQRSYICTDWDGNVVLDFFDENMEKTCVDEYGNLLELDGFTYLDKNNNMVTIHRTYYVNGKREEVEPDTISGMYSDMAHVLSFLGLSYDEIFDVLMMDKELASLMVPFQTAYKNKAMDQLEGMCGTLRVMAAPLVTQESFWIFTGDDFDLKVTDPADPTYLVIANDPDMQDITGALNALVLNRLITKVNSGMGKNIPVSIIVDECPTLYVHKIDNLIATARSNKVAVTLGLQEKPQLEANYGKNGMEKIMSTCGNIIAGQARYKETLEWLQNDIFGKVKQTSHNVSISDSGTSHSINEKMDYMVPASKIADMASGWLCGQTARDFVKTEKGDGERINIEESEEFKTTKFFCKTNFNMDRIKNEKKHYVDLPEIYKFASEKDMRRQLSHNLDRVNMEVKMLTDEILGHIPA